jgi:hypothetical protein
MLYVAAWTFFFLEEALPLPTKVVYFGMLHVAACSCTFCSLEKALPRHDTKRYERMKQRQDSMTRGKRQEESVSE